MSQVSRHQVVLIVVLTCALVLLAAVSWPRPGNVGSGSTGQPGRPTAQAGQNRPARPSASTTTQASPSSTVGDRPPLATGRWPGEGTAGVRSGGSSAPWTAGTSGLDEISDRSYDRVTAPAVAVGAWTFTGNNLTFRDCGFPHGVVFTGDHIRVEHCDIAAGITLNGAQHVVLIGNDIRDWDEAVRVASVAGKATDIEIRDNWLHRPACGDHADGIRLLGADGVVITNNTIDLGPWSACTRLNSALLTESTNGPDVNLTITDNLLNGGAYTVHFAACAKTRFQDNHFGPDAHLGPVNAAANPSCFTRWSGNVWDLSGKPVNPTS